MWATTSPSPGLTLNPRRLYALILSSQTPLHVELSYLPIAPALFHCTRRYSSVSLVPSKTKAWPGGVSRLVQRRNLRLSGATRALSALSATAIRQAPHPTSHLGKSRESMEPCGHGSPEPATRAPGEMKAPYVEQDPQRVVSLCQELEDMTKNKTKHSSGIKKTRYAVDGSRDGLTVDSWRFHDFEYKKRHLPTYARGLFTTRTRNNVPEIAIRGYDKFFNVGEVPETRWGTIEEQTTGPYELTLKENGCIIFISGLDDGTLLVCSKHSTGNRSDVEMSHSAAGERHMERQLEALGRTKEDFARELRARNITAVAELCDDEFEEHILAYGPDKAGLYLHGVNVNVPEFVTYPSALVQQFAGEWGFRKIGLITMDSIGEVKKFLEEVAESGAHGGRDVEGFVVRCKRSHDPDKVPYHDWFFKFKFEEPYLLYRQWRECTKAIIAGKQPKFKKHSAITKEYLVFAKKRLIANPKLGTLYNQNHGIIALRDEFLEFKKMNGADAAKLEEMSGGDSTGARAEVSRDVVLVPIATIGCGKTTVAVALSKLFNFGHVQNDNIAGSKRPPRFTKMILEQLQDHVAVTADRNNSAKNERKQILTDFQIQHGAARLVALNFVHDDINKVRQVTHDRVFARGDNHQTIQAATEPKKVEAIMEGFLNRFEPVQEWAPPDNGFDAVINLDPAVGSRTNLETVVTELKRLYPSLIPHVPSAEDMDRAINEALSEYRPDIRHTIPDRGPRRDNKKASAPPPKQQKKMKPLEYMSVEVPAKDINALLEKTFGGVDAEKSRFYEQLKDAGRVQPRFHVTLIHRAAAKEHPELWERYVKLQVEGEASNGVPDGKIGECDVLLERVVFDGRIMAIVVRLVDAGRKWECVNKVSHITVGTRDDSVKPKESNDLLARWLEDGTIAQELGFEGRPTIKGTVRPIMSR